MSYIGNQPSNQAFAADTFVGTGSQTVFNLSYAAVNAPGLLTKVGGVVQTPDSAYTVTGNTITFTEAPPVDTEVVVVFLGTPLEIGQTTADNIQVESDLGNKANLQALLNTNLGVNLIINPNGEIDQENVGTVTDITNGGYTADMWKLFKNTTGTVNYSRSSDTPNNRSRTSVQLSVGTADATVAANEVVILNTFIEGYDYSPYHNDQTLTLSFWVKNTKAGQYYIGLRNNASGGGVYSKILPYTINTPGVWEKKEITFQTADVGVWEFTNEFGIQISFTLMAGTDFHGSVTDQWNNENKLSLSDQENWMDQIGNTINITQVKLEPGGLATPFIPRKYQEEYRLCMRYYEKLFDDGTAPGAPSDNVGELLRLAFATSSSNTVGYFIKFNVEKRTSNPIIDLYPRGVAGSAGNVQVAGTARAASVERTEKIGFLGITNNSGVTWAISDTLTFHWTADDRF